MSIKLYDSVTLYGKKRLIREYNAKTHAWEDIGETVDYYVADTNDKSQNGTGKNWATEKHIVYENGVAIRDENGKFVCKVIPPIVYTTENKDFRLEIDMSAKNSSQGGKLAFWMCKISKTLEDGTVIEGDIGINQEELKDLLRESTFINGVCQESVAFYRINGNVGVCTMTGEKYQQALKDKAEDKKLKNAKKTTKWELGRVYKTKTMSSIWVGDVIHPLKGKLHATIDGRYVNESLQDVCKNAYFGWVDKFPSRVAMDETIDVTGFSKFFDQSQEEKLREELSHKVYTYRMEESLCYMNGLDKTLVREYLLQATMIAIWKKDDYYWSSNHTEKLLKKIEDLCEHFNLDYDEIYKEASECKNK